jgi:1-acyl-sn-glycerol-3-phosphate acyltransferase
MVALRRWLGAFQDGDQHNLDMVDHRLLARAKPFADFWRRYFRYSVQGMDNVPADGGALIVSPHSTITLDGFLLGHALYEERGRLPRGLADHFLFAVPGLRDFILKIGIVDGNRDNAVALLQRGELCAAMPGGGREAFKPSRENYRLRWEGHTGFVRVAIRGQAPVIPTVCIGSEEAIWMPFDSMAWGERLLGARLPIFLGVGLFGLVPMPFPVRFTAYIGTPIHFDVPVEAADDDEVVKRCHAKVVTAVEELIEKGLAERRSLF